MADEFAPGSTGDLISARNSQRAALQAAAEMKARGHALAARGLGAAGSADQTRRCDDHLAPLTAKLA